jgi:hypothetical protein
VEVVQPRGIDLRPVGFFEELGLASHYVGKMQKMIQGQASANERMVIDYLKSGYVLLDAPETAVDAIDGRARIAGASSLVSDGTWLWRLDLVHYLSKYHLSLPGDFIEHLAQRNYLMSELSESDLEIITTEAIRFF